MEGAPNRTGTRGAGLRLLALLAGLTALACVGAAGRAQGTTAQEQPSVYSGLGFDTCEAPSLATLQAWLASPYRALGIYIGGENRACPNAQLSASWVVSAEALGWALAPLYVGLQAPCTGQAGVTTVDAANAAAQGSADAASAAGDAGGLGLPAGSPIYFDMEGYALANPGCTQAVQTFLSSWVGGLHAAGYLAGVYGSAASTMRDLQALSTTADAPDDVWIADWNGSTSVTGDPYVSDALWQQQQRIHQFSGGHDESYGGVSLDIDGDVFDGAVVGTSGAPAGPVPAPAPAAAAPAAPAAGAATAPPPAPAAPSTAGSVSTSDGQASVSWPAGSFARSVVVTLTPSLPATPIDGFGPGGYGVNLQVDQTASSLETPSFAVPLTIAIAPQAGVLAPVDSADGVTWTALPQLVGGVLPLGVQAGYAREPGGAVEIQTRTPGHFALLPDPTPPAAPARLDGAFSHGALVLHWPDSTGALGPAVSYEVTLGGKPLLTVSGETTAALHSFKSHGPSVYRVRAIDAAAQESAASVPLVVLPTPRPGSVPRALPPWAWTVFGWQQHGQTGPRPLAPRVLPGWYWRWRAWRVGPFHLRA